MMNGINSGVRETAKQPALLAALAAVNPVVLLVGIAGVAAFALFASAKGGKKSKDQPLPTVEKPPLQRLPNGSRTVNSTVKSTVDSAITNGSGTIKNMSEKELIRQAMSKLGKRSAAARARKHSKGQA